MYERYGVRSTEKGGVCEAVKARKTSVKIHWNIRLHSGHQNVNKKKILIEKKKIFLRQFEIFPWNQGYITKMDFSVRERRNRKEDIQLQSSSSGAEEEKEGIKFRSSFPQEEKLQVLEYRLKLQ